MRIYDNGTYRDETADEKALRESIIGEHVVSINERVAILEENRFAKNINNVTLLSDNWVGEVSPYSQVVDIAGTTPHSKVDLQPSADQLTVFHEKDLTFVTENENGVVTVFCIGQKPTNDYIIQAVITEVVVNE